MKPQAAGTGTANTRTTSFILISFLPLLAVHGTGHHHLLSPSLPVKLDISSCLGGPPALTAVAGRFAGAPILTATAINSMPEIRQRAMAERTWDAVDVPFSCGRVSGRGWPGVRWRLRCRTTRFVTCHFHTPVACISCALYATPRQTSMFSARRRVGHGRTRATRRTHCLLPHAFPRHMHARVRSLPFIHLAR